MMDVVRHRTQGQDRDAAPPGDRREDSEKHQVVTGGIEDNPLPLGHLADVVYFAGIDFSPFHGRYFSGKLRERIGP